MRRDRGVGGGHRLKCGFAGADVGAGQAPACVHPLTDGRALPTGSPRRVVKFFGVVLLRGQRELDGALDNPCV